MTSAPNLIDQFRELARYNSWMNLKIYELCDRIPDAERMRDRGAFFSSIHGTLNHLLLTDRVQLGRFIGADRVRLNDASGNEIPIRSLDQELYSDFGVLRSQRVLMDALIESFAADVTPEFLSREMTYEAMSATGRYRVPMWVAVTHFFNHQTHHRGQVTTMLSQAGIDPGVTDFMAMLREKIA